MSRACARPKARRFSPTMCRSTRTSWSPIWRTNGAIVYAMSNTPEFGAGANTFNEVFGRTLNPWNTSRSAAGSSGGAAVALATGMAWLAHGSDLGGSLAQPRELLRRRRHAAIARPGGRHVPARHRRDARRRRPHGPQCRRPGAAFRCHDRRRTAAIPCRCRGPDIVLRGRPLRLEAKARRHQPRSRHHAGRSRKSPTSSRRRRCRFAGAGVIVEEAHPDFSEAHECFHVCARCCFAVERKPMFENHRAKLKPEVIWNIEKGLALTGAEIVPRRAPARRDVPAHASNSSKPMTCCLRPPPSFLPFRSSSAMSRDCNGHRFANYFEWLAIAYAITLVCCPALSLPCGFTRDGLPVGLADRRTAARRGRGAGRCEDARRRSGR